MLAGVVAYTIVAGVAIVLVTENDWIALLAFVVVVGTSAAVLNKTGQERAARDLNPLYGVQKLPTDELSGRIRAAMIIATLLILVAVVAATARPGEKGSPLPHFLAFAFLFLVMPQITGRIAVRRANRRNLLAS